MGGKLNSLIAPPQGEIALVACLFPGQGSQYPGIGRELESRFSVAKKTFDEATEALEMDVRDLAWNSSDRELARTENAQVAIVTASVAAWRVWREEQVPANSSHFLFAGHSVGAVSASIASGHLSFREGIILARARGELMSRAPEKGSMIAVAVPIAASRDLALEFAHENNLDIAAFNGEKQIVLSGAETNVELAKTHFGAKSRVLNVSHGFHSRLMDPIMEDWSRLVANLDFLSSDQFYFGSATGKFTGSSEDVRVDLRLGLRAPVRWDSVMQEASKATKWFTFGPGSALLRLARPHMVGRVMSAIDDCFKGKDTQ